MASILAYLLLLAQVHLCLGDLMRNQRDTWPFHTNHTSKHKHGKSNETVGAKNTASRKLSAVHDNDSTDTTNAASQATGHASHKSLQSSSADHGNVTKQSHKELQAQSNAWSSSGASSDDDGDKSACAPLNNRGTYFTLNIKVGTPGQTFAVVADTGSDAVIVPSCICKERGSCNKQDRCFKGTNKSSTFLIGGTNSSMVTNPKNLPMVNMAFGSGEVRALVATDVVTIGNVHSLMKNGVLLMVDQALRVSGPFEGILGLGPPKNKSVLLAEAKNMAVDNNHVSRSVSPNGHNSAASKVIRKIMKKAMGGTEIGVTNALEGTEFESEGQSEMHALELVDRYWPKAGKEPIGIHKSLPAEVFKPSSFLKTSGMPDFSVCFNDRGQDGALNFGHQKAKNSLTSIGSAHWGLDFQGISVGSTSAKVKFCGPKDKKKHQKTACGAIPDSGTTLFMAPEKHIHMLFEEICDGWDRCKTAVNQGLQKKKAMIFMMLLRSCGDWMKNDTELSELPKLHLRMAGGNGKREILTLGGMDYIAETMEDEMEVVTRNMMGASVKVMEKTGDKKKVCVPAFSTMEYHTKQNGAVWIMGAPLFYKYKVAYELDPKEPGISFSSGTCGCPSQGKKNAASLVGGRALRELHGPPRMPSIDLTQEL